MLQITVPEQEYYDEEQNCFITKKSEVLTLEHSLISISRWESRWHVPFLKEARTKDQEKTKEQVIDYVRCMSINKPKDLDIYNRLSSKNLDDVNDYINDSHTATWFRDEKKSPNREQVTSELIYYWMISMQIPFECQKWHLNRLLTLIRICSIKNQPKKKMSRQEILAQNRALNEARRKQLGTKG